MMKNVPRISQSSITYFLLYPSFFKTYFISISCPLFLFFFQYSSLPLTFFFLLFVFFFFYLTNEETSRIFRLIKRERSRYRSVMFVYISMHANEYLPFLLIRLNIECITFLVHIYLYTYILIPFKQNESKIHTEKSVILYMKHHFTVYRLHCRL